MLETEAQLKKVSIPVRLFSITVPQPQQAIDILLLYLLVVVKAKEGGAILLHL